MSEKTTTAYLATCPECRETTTVPAGKDPESPYWDEVYSQCEACEAVFHVGRAERMPDGD